MIKNLTLISRREDHSREAFREHYERTHAPLALTRIHVFERYVRNHVAEELSGGVPDFDVATEFWFAGGEAVKTVTSLLEGDFGDVIRADERSFMNRESVTSIPVVERSVHGPDREAKVGEAQKVVAFLRRPEGSPRGDFVRSLEAGPLAQLLEAAPPLRCTSNAALEMPGPEPPYDCAVMLWYPAAAGVPDAVRGWKPDAGSALLLRVHEDETPRHALPG